MLAFGPRWCVGGRGHGTVIEGSIVEKLFICIIMAFVLSGALPSHETDAPPAETMSAEVAKLWELFARLWDENSAFEPLGATVLGDYRFNAQLGSLSKEMSVKHVEELKAIKAEVDAIDVDGLSPLQKTHYDYLKEMLSIEIDSFEKLRMYEFPTQHMFGPHLTIAQAANFHPWRDEKDCASYFDRIRQFDRQVDEMIEAFKEGIANGRTLPVGSVNAMIPQLKAQVVSDPTESSVYKLAEPKVKSVNGDVEQLRIIVEQVIVPAFTKLSDFIENEYQAHARKDAGLWAIPGGDEAYKAAIHYFTSLELDPQDLHELGKREIARIQKLIDEVRNELGDTDGSLNEFARRMENNPKYLPKDGDEIISRYQAILELAKTKTLEYFKALPAAELDIKPVEEFRAAASPAAHYYPPPADRSRPGLFYANTYKPETRPTFAMEAIALHEGIPGHHMQIAIAQELTGLPRVRKELQEFTIGYAEGWGLYTEYLGEVMKFYGDPVTYYGRLVTEIWRAARLVVDTGIHHLKWSREDAIQYMKDNTCLGENEAMVEIDRYTVMPGQALSYKVGEQKILELKNYAQVELGDKFSWKGFHEVILKDGALPLVVLETTVKEWVKSVKEA